MERSRGWILKQALAAWIAQEEEKDRLTREALEDVDAGYVVEHRVVQGMGRTNRYRSTLADARARDGEIRWTGKGLSDLEQSLRFSCPE